MQVFSALICTCSLLGAPIGLLGILVAHFELRSGKVQDYAFVGCE